MLDAYNSSFLSITGNSTSLARWDSRLGFVNTPFAATLRSLSADGGVITRMDVVLTRVYDHAWVDVDSRGGAGAVPRGDEEEEKLQREWEKKRQMELEKLQEEWSKTTRRAESLREMIENEAEGCREDYSLGKFQISVDSFVSFLSIVLTKSSYLPLSTLQIYSQRLRNCWTR